MKRVRVLAWLVGMACGHSVSAAWVGAEFSADVVQTDAQQQATQGRMYASQGRVRSEFVQGGRKVIQIVDPSRQLVYTLFPEQQNYREQHGPAPSGAGTDPCVGLPPGMQCKKLGRETWQGRPVEGYEITGIQDGKPVQSRQWIDTERQIPLKVETPDGGKMALNFITTESLQGRTAEKWELVQTAPNMPTRSLFQWYDPQLGLAIKEEMPGGFVRELRNIQLAPQDVQLFALPPGYQPLPQVNANPGGAPATQPPGLR